jgi:hypothetical protein
MSLIGVLGKVRKVVGVIADILIFLRGKGWVSEKPTVPKKKEKR